MNSIKKKLKDNLNILLNYYPFDRDYIENGGKYGGAYGDIIDDKPNGTWLIFYPSLKLEKVLNYKHGILHGEYFTYNEITQSITAYRKFKDGKELKFERYYDTYYIGCRGLKRGKYLKLCPESWFQSKYPRYYPIPKELENIVNKYYLLYEFYEEELYKEYRKSLKLKLPPPICNRPHKDEHLDPIAKINEFNTFLDGVLNNDNIKSPTDTLYPIYQ